jgi:hypothetical protein
LEDLCMRCRDMDLQNSGQALVFLCHFAQPERYCICVDKALVSLFERIPIERIFKSLTAKTFETSPKSLRKCSSVNYPI